MSKFEDDGHLTKRVGYLAIATKTRVYRPMELESFSQANSLTLCESFEPSQLSQPQANEQHSVS